MIDPQSVKGFLAPDEGEALADAACQVGQLGPIVEIGSYCGKSALYLGPAARSSGTHLFSIDHHRGSEEHQKGEGYHDPALFDDALNAVETLPEFRRTIHKAKLEDCVIAIVGHSRDVARYWQTSTGMVFIDGGHSMAAAQADYDGWAHTIAPGGILAIHDVFPDPKDGGRPPHEIWKQAVASREFEPIERVNTLEMLRRLA
jgi:MMP 1-O-methyltransferase